MQRYKTTQGDVPVTLLKTITFTKLSVRETELPLSEKLRQL